MHVNKAEPLGHQAVVFYETQDFAMFRRKSHRKGLQECEDFSPLLEVLACEFAHNEGVTQDLGVLQQVFKDRLAIPEML